MLSRLLNLFKAKVNKGMSQLETPEILAEQAVNELEESVKKVKEGVVASLTNEKMMEQQIKKAKDEITNWEKRAALAVGQNNDEVARQCLQKKQELNQNAMNLTQQLDDQKKSTASLKARYEELVGQLRDLQRKKVDLTARSQASDSVTKATELLSGSPGSDVAKWEQKIAEKEFRAEAGRQMSSEPVSDKFAELDHKMQVDDELEALKAQMAASKPKLIVDSESKPAKTVVDENVPMVIDEDKPEDKKS